MRLLLDTHVFLWWVDGSSSISSRARAAIADPDNECFLSLASCWEMAIKIRTGKLALPAALEQFIPEQLTINGFRQLDISFRHVARVATMPLHHRDPFDRLLAAQAAEDNLTVVSADPILRKYGIKRIY